MAIADPEAAPQGETLLQSLLASGRLRIDQKLAGEVADPGGVSVLRVELAPGVVEPPHTHPGLEILYGLAGAGVVELDGRERLPIAPDTVVRVEAGRVKALSNQDSHQPLAVVAILLLEPGRPPLTIAG